MAVDFPGFASPAAGFEVPLEMLAACHLRIAQHHAGLQRLSAHLACHVVDADVRAAAAAVMRYFDTAARHHHEDEEVDLFPALIESMAGSDAVCLRDMVAELTTDHREIERRWQDLRPALELLSNGANAELDNQAVDEFVSVYQRHIAREESDLLPMASRLLSDADLDRVGAAMRKRRGLGIQSSPHLEHR